jgi:hypothetical protein
MAEYVFTQKPQGDRVRIEWTKAGRKPDPLDFWIVPPSEVEQAKARVLAGEFDG